MRSNKRTLERANERVNDRPIELGLTKTTLRKRSHMRKLLVSSVCKLVYVCVSAKTAGRVRNFSALPTSAHAPGRHSVMPTGSHGFFPHVR